MEDLDALLADLQITSPNRCPVLLTDCQEGMESCEQQRPPPPPYDHKTVMPLSDPDEDQSSADKSHLYSTVKKYGAPSVSPVVGGGLCELDRLLNELNATQFNITDEIMSQFPPREKKMLERPEDKRLLSASSATLELDRLMASLSDFHKQNTASLTQESLSRPGESEWSYSDIPEPIPNPAAIVMPANKVEECHVVVPTGQTEEAPSTKSMEGVGRNELDSMLVTLQSGLNQQGIETHSKGVCHSCQRPIAGQVVTALGHTWHPEHFVCAHCKALIGSTNFFEKDGRPYCEKDYFDIHAPRCALCNLPILQNLVTALGCTWHPEHFCCKVCKKAIGEEGFHEKEGEPYCSEDYFRLFGAVCSGCSGPVKESYISALNGLWHPQCFVCHVCHTPFINGSFFENDGLPLCETHYHSSRGSLCAGCEQPITGRCVTAMGRKFHPQHLSCTFCLRQLNKGTFREQDGKPYCQACFARLYG